MKTRTQHVVCWVEPYFELIDVATFCHVLSVAGSNWNWRPYRLSLASEQGGVVPSRSQVSVQTVPLTSCAVPDVVILACGERPSYEGAGPTIEGWSVAELTWIVFRDSIKTFMRFGVAVDTLAVSAAGRKAVLDACSNAQFSPKDFHFDARVLSCATLDVLPGALGFVERQLGRSARRYVEAQLGLTQSPVNLYSGKLEP